MSNYSLVLLLRRDLKKDAKDKLVAEVQALCGEGKFEKPEMMGEKKLMYPIKREQSADYIVLNFSTEKLNTELNRRLLLREEIIRHLLVRN